MTKVKKGKTRKENRKLEITEVPVSATNVARGAPRKSLNVARGALPD